MVDKEGRWGGHQQPSGLIRILHSKAILQKQGKQA